MSDETENQSSSSGAIEPEELGDAGDTYEGDNYPELSIDTLSEQKHGDEVPYPEPEMERRDYSQEDGVIFLIETDGEGNSSD
jgi:hypothetical protein